MTAQTVGTIWCEETDSMQRFRGRHTFLPLLLSPKQLSLFYIVVLLHVLPKEPKALPSRPGVDNNLYSGAELAIYRNYRRAQNLARKSFLSKTME